VTFQLAAE